MQIRRALKYLVFWLLAPALVLLLACLLVYGWFRLNPQRDDAVHLAAKQRYLVGLAQQPGGTRRPNIVLILFDDLGYGDFGVTGSRAIRTPHIDRLAREGMLLRNYYAPAPSCTPSRAGMLTGRQPLRAGLPEVTFQDGSLMQALVRLRGSNTRLPAEEITLADVLKARGYRTGIVGKWHIGDIAPSLPRDFGFDFFYGTRYSIDMDPFELYRNARVEEPAPFDKTRLNALLQRESTNFIAAPDPRPFFLYFAHHFPHVPLFASKADSGRSAAGLYGDVVQALDDTVGAVVAALERKGVLDDTLILITSDNGPWFEGSTGGHRGRKGETFDGGTHVPMVIHWPHGVAAGQVRDDPVMGIDLFPTVLDLLGADAPRDRIIDGHSLLPMLGGQAPGPAAPLYFFAGDRLMGLRDGRFKYRAPQPYLYGPEPTGIAIPLKQPERLFDLSIDPDEAYDAARVHPMQLQAMRELLQAKSREMTENPRGWRTP